MLIAIRCVFVVVVVVLVVHTHHFKGNVLCRLGLDGCLPDSKSPVILILSILRGQVKSSSPQGKWAFLHWSVSFYGMDAFPVTQSSTTTATNNNHYCYYIWFGICHIHIVLITNKFLGVLNSNYLFSAVVFVGQVTIGVIYACDRTGSTFCHQIIIDISPARTTVILDLIHLLKYKLCLPRKICRHLWTWIQRRRYSLTSRLFSLHCILFMRSSHQMSLCSFFYIVWHWKLWCDTLLFCASCV